MSKVNAAKSGTIAANLSRFAILAIGASLTLAVGPFHLAGDYGAFLLATIATSAIAVLTVTLLAGLSGIWSLGNTAFVAVGAYLTVNLAAQGVPLEGIVLTSIALAGMTGYVIGLSAGRFSVLYFGLLTLALSLTAAEIIGQWASVTGGDQGIAVPPLRLWLAGRTLTLADGAPVAMALATFVFLIAGIIARGATGRRWLAVKSQRTASMAIGLVPHRENAFAFGLSAALASVAGIASAATINYIDPEGFNLHAGVMLIVATVIGGVGSIGGAIFGAAFIVYVPELARELPSVSSFVMGTSMILVLLFLRRGIVPGLVLSAEWRGKRPSNSSLNESRIDGAIDPKIVPMVQSLLPSASGALAVEHLSVSFSGVKALDDVSLLVRPGQTVGLIGPNGAGKTTLLNALSGFVPSCSYEKLTLGNADLGLLPPHRRIACGLGRTFQHAELFEELTIREMVTMVAHLRKKTGAQKSLSDAHAIAAQIVGTLGLASVADQYPKALPFGIQKIADIARILAAGASFIALDEPFSGLDRAEVRELRSIIRGMKQAGVSILIIDHAVHEVLDIADEIVVLDFGRVLAKGTPREIQRNTEVQRAYFGTPAAPRVLTAGQGVENV
jgi:branched-chain amino acid transport system permease protein